MMIRRAVKVTRNRSPEIIFVVLDEKGDTHELLLWMNKNFFKAGLSQENNLVFRCFALEHNAFKAKHLRMGMS